MTDPAAGGRVAGAVVTAVQVLQTQERLLGRLGAAQLQPGGDLQPRLAPVPGPADRRVQQTVEFAVEVPQDRHLVQGVVAEDDSVAAFVAVDVLDRREQVFWVQVGRWEVGLMRRAAADDRVHGRAGGTGFYTGSSRTHRFNILLNGLDGCKRPSRTGDGPGLGGVRSGPSPAWPGRLQTEITGW